MIEINSGARLHVTLIDLGTATRRRHGGAGFSLCGPNVRVRASHSPINKLSGLELVDDRSRTDLERVLERAGGVGTQAPAHVEILEVPPQHVGLGTKTALLLSALTAVSALSESSLSRSQFQVLSGRGGVSGIGVHAFFDGGYIVDVGHRREGDSTFVPSSARIEFTIPPICCCARIPERWAFTLLLPLGGRYAGHDEVKFFRENTPIPDSEILQVLSLVQHGLTPAVLEEDFQELRSSLRAIQRIGFKARERATHGPLLQELSTELERRPDCAVGMSSLGPLLYVIRERQESVVEEEIRSIADNYGVSFLGTFTGRNSGFEMQT